MNAVPIFLLTAFALVPAAAPGARASVTLRSSCNAPARWAPRHDAGLSRFAITTRDRDATLLLTDEVVAVQLSDRAMHRIDRKLRDKEDDDEDNALSSAIKQAVLSSVRALLDHSAECRIRDVRDVDYREGRLSFVTEGGERLFDGIDVDDEDVMSGFSDADARAFVREFRRLKSRGR